MLLHPHRTRGGYEVRNSVGDADTGTVVVHFEGWRPAALVCAWVWYSKHTKEYA